jgi:hypothetical protein
VQKRTIRWLVFLGLIAFLPLFYFLAVVGGFLPYGAILIMGLRNIGDSWMMLYSAVHLAIYGVALFWLSGLMARLIVRVAGDHVKPATAIVLLALAGIGLLPIYGVAHGEIQWRNAYALYTSESLR